MCTYCKESLLWDRAPRAIIKMFVKSIMCVTFTACQSFEYYIRIVALCLWRVRFIQTISIRSHSSGFVFVNFVKIDSPASVCLCQYLRFYSIHYIATIASLPLSRTNTQKHTHTPHTPTHKTKTLHTFDWLYSIGCLQLLLLPASTYYSHFPLSSPPRRFYLHFSFIPSHSIWKFLPTSNHSSIIVERLRARPRAIRTNQRTEPFQFVYFPFI